MMGFLALKHNPLIHPFLFALQPFLALLPENAQEIPLDQAYDPSLLRLMKVSDELRPQGVQPS